MAIFWHLVQQEDGGQTRETNQVVGIDHIPQLAKWADDNLRKDGLGDALDQGQMKVIKGDGRLGESAQGSVSMEKKWSFLLKHYLSFRIQAIHREGHTMQFMSEQQHLRFLTLLSNS
jgi:hypothetical protein